MTPRIRLKIIHLDGKDTTIDTRLESYNHQVYLNYLKLKEEGKPVPPILRFIEISQYYAIDDIYRRREFRERNHTPLEPIKTIRVMSETIVRIEEN